MRLVVGAATDVGRVRDGNEDAYLVDDAMGLVAVADGMGGHRGGEVASATALEALRAAVSAGRPLREAVEDANTAVFDKAGTDDSLHGMGTTLTAATLAAGGTLLIGHVGDSRAYLLRDGELRQVTTDHSLVEELVRDGRLTPDEAAVHPQRSIITRALGVDATVDVDVYPVELAAGDVLLFCSDGLTGMLQPDLIAAELRREYDPGRAATRLVDAANAAGGEDNITVVVVSVTGDAPERATIVAPVAADPIPRGEAPTEEARPPKRRGRKVAKLLLWVLPVVLVLAVAIGAVGWYARRSYYVGVHHGNVTVFKGVPGGLAGWDPTIERVYPALAVAELRAADRASVRAQHHFSSRADAEAFVARVRDHAGPSTGASTTTTAPTTTTTTTPPGATTTTGAPAATTPTAAPGP
jgi:protein phosphatase